MRYADSTSRFGPAGFTLIELIITIAIAGVLATLARSLAAMTDRETGLIYVSDHGESLGENGIYLHIRQYNLRYLTCPPAPSQINPNK